MPNQYPVPLFVYLQCILTHDSYANQDSERLNSIGEKKRKRKHVEYMLHSVISTCTCFDCVNAANV